MAENVRKLDTINFNQTINDYGNKIKQFEEIVEKVNRAANNAVEHWKGKGCDAFEKDYKQVQINLKDISDIMYDMRDALIDAHAEYMKTDKSLSKDFES